MKIGENVHRIADAVVTNHAGILTVRTPIVPMMPGSQTSVGVEIVNRSEQVWMGDAFHPLNLSYHWMKGSEIMLFDGLRTPLPAGSVGSGQSLAIEMLVEATQETGKHTLVLTLVQESVCWFENKGFEPARVEVEILAYSHIPECCAMSGRIGERNQQL